MLRLKLPIVEMTYDSNFCAICRPFPWYLRMVGGVPTRKQLGVKASLWAANSAKFRKATKEFPEVLMRYHSLELIIESELLALDL